MSFSSKFNYHYRDYESVQSIAHDEHCSSHTMCIVLHEEASAPITRFNVETKIKLSHVKNETKTEKRL